MASVARSLLDVRGSGAALDPWAEDASGGSVSTVFVGSRSGDGMFV
jgi:hypothetical protein